jgi:hypothetical protein
MEMLGTLPRDRWRRVRAEDLLRAPDTFAPPIYEWLGLRCDAHILATIKHTERWEFASAGKHGTLMGGDPKFMMAPKLRPVSDPGPVIFDPEWGLSQEMCSRMTDLAVVLGYQAPEGVDVRSSVSL